MILKRSGAMNIYHELNKMMDYIEENLDNYISYTKLSRILGVNEYTMQRLFSLLCNISLAEYIRKRRLSQAGYDIVYKQGKIIEIAFKYGYENPTSFSRAFEKFHGMKPSKVKKEKAIKNFPKMYFNEQINTKSEMEYKIITLDAFTLYGKGMKTTENMISKDAPSFCENMNELYSNKYGSFDYGMVLYEDRFNSDNFEYWILWRKEIEEFEKIEFPKCKWLLFHIPNTKAVDIQKVSHEFYYEFLPSCKYNLRELPELEYYHDGVTDFLVPIE